MMYVWAKHHRLTDDGQHVQWFLYRSKTEIEKLHFETH